MAGEEILGNGDNYGIGVPRQRGLAPEIGKVVKLGEAHLVDASPAVGLAFFGEGSLDEKAKKIAEIAADDRDPTTLRSADYALLNLDEARAAAAEQAEA